MTNFNGKQGCLKCTTVGEYSYKSHTVFFPRTGCEKRTNEGFREKKYGSHHKHDTPLTSLPIDMIEDFPVGDSLHLIDLGIVKKCLLGWRDGSFGNYKTKWCAKDIATVSNFLENCKMPSEIHRSVRGLDVLCHWKGSEYHTFICYLGFVILKEVLPTDVYQHFLKFFCAVTILSSKIYNNFLDLAQALMDHYVEHYRDFYGEDYMTSNVHNLTHLVDEVKKFGPLSTFSAYPFESRLYQIKNLLRSGNLPLAQVARRMGEIMQCENDSFKKSKGFLGFPVLKNRNSAGNFSKIQMENFTLSTDNPNKWFLTNDNHVVAMQYVTLRNQVPFIFGSCVSGLQDVFEMPIKSSYLNIFQSHHTEKGASYFYPISEIKCKLVVIKHGNVSVFIPLLHTMQM